MSGVLNTSHTAGFTFNFNDQIADHPAVESYQRGGSRRRRKALRTRRRRTARTHRRKSRRTRRSRSQRKSRSRKSRSKKRSRRSKKRSRRSKKSSLEKKVAPNYIPKFEDYDLKPVIGRMGPN